MFSVAPAGVISIGAGGAFRVSSVVWPQSIPWPAYRRWKVEDGEEMRTAPGSGIWLQEDLGVDRVLLPLLLLLGG